jgi:hypothetical protein
MGNAGNFAGGQSLYAKVSHVIPEIEWVVHAPLVEAINRLKHERNAVILGHNYMTPEIYHCVADFVGDSLQLAREAAATDARVIVQAGVHFMAETSKVLSPGKTVLIPDMQAGCSLAASITGADVRLLKQKYPGLPIVTYVNTSAEVKAESDVCCTSSNAKAVVEDIARKWGVDTVIMIPDEYLAQNVAKQTPVKIIAWKGRCEVHERFTAADLHAYRERFRRVHLGDDFLCRYASTGPRGDGDGMLDERQCGGRISGGRFRAALQSVSAHETHFAGEHPARAGDDDHGSGGRSRDRRTGAQGGRAHVGGADAAAAPGGVSVPWRERSTMSSRSRAH